MTTAPRPGSPTSSYTVTYDAWNRLVEIKAGEYVVVKNEYDGLNRRVKQHVNPDYNDDSYDQFRHFFYNNKWQVFETRESGTAETGPESLDPEYQFVWSLRYIDSPICRDENKDADGDCVDGDDERLYYLTDANMNVTTLVDTGGDAVERYAYDAYGEVTIYEGDWSAAQSAETYSNTILFAGYWRDSRTGLYHVRNRYYHPALGRWLQRDPAGYIDGMSLYEYVKSRPIGRVDPSGHLSWGWHAEKGHTVSDVKYFEPGMAWSAESAHVTYSIRFPDVGAGSSSITVRTYAKAVYQVWSWYSLGMGETGLVAKHRGTWVLTCDPGTGRITHTYTHSTVKKSGPAFVSATVDVNYDGEPSTSIHQVSLAEVGVGIQAGVTGTKSATVGINYTVNGQVKTGGGLSAGPVSTSGSQTVGGSVGAGYSETITTHVGTTLAGGALRKYACSPCWKESEDGED